MVGQTSCGRAAKSGVVNSPVGEESLYRHSGVVEIDGHRIRLGIFRQRVMRGERASAVLRALDIDDRMLVCDVHRSTRVSQLVGVGAQPR